MRRFRIQLLVLVMLSIAALVTSPAVSENLKVGIYPSNAPEKLYPAMEILASHLSKHSPFTFTAIVTKDYQELSERLRNGSIDIAWINPINYVKLKAEQPALQYLATYMEKSEETGEIIPYYYSFILSLKSSGIVNINELQGKLFAFTDLGSTSGYAYPKMILRKHGISPDTFFSKVYFLKQHDRVIEALKSGSIDGGAVSDGTYYTAVRKYGDLFTILAQSEPIPLDAILAAKHVPPDTVSLLQNLLTKIDLNHPFNQAMKENLGWNAAGFEVRNDTFYNPLREALQ